VSKSPILTEGSLLLEIVDGFGRYLDSTGDKTSPIVPNENPTEDETNVIVHCKDLTGD
jgi:hypothetical protein